MLRPHQKRAIDMLRQSIRKGNNRAVLAAPCSFGKTRVATEILKSVVANGKRGIFICDRIKLVDQALQEFDRAGIQCGVMQGEHWRTDPNAPVQIASIQTLARKRYQPLFNVRYKWIKFRLESDYMLIDADVFKLISIISNASVHITCL